MTIMARWVIELNCKCPKCDDYIDLLDNGDFWEDNRVECLERDTKKSRGVNVFCAECEHEFKVDLEY